MAKFRITFCGLNNPNFIGTLCVCVSLTLSSLCTKRSPQIRITHSLEIVDLVVQELANVPRQIVVAIDERHCVQQLIGHVQSLLERRPCVRRENGVELKIAIQFTSGAAEKPGPRNVPQSPLDSNNARTHVEKRHGRVEGRKARVLRHIGERKNKNNHKHSPSATRKASGTATPTAPTINSIDVTASQCLVGFQPGDDETK